MSSTPTKVCLANAKLLNPSMGRITHFTPYLLVSTAWVAEHRRDPNMRIVESDEDILLYDVEHIPGAIKVDWQSELQHQVVRDYIDKDAFGRLIGSKGIQSDHTVVFYGDRNNWWACYAFWVFMMRQSL